MIRNWIIGLALLALVVTVGYQGIAGNKQYDLPEEEAAKVGYFAPSFTLEGLDGDEYAVGGKRDKALLINFWASWCYPCQEEAPDLVEMYEKYSDDLDIYAVNVMKTDSMSGVEKFVDEYNIDFPVLIDEDNEIFDLYRALYLPTNILIDRNGVIREIVNGMLLPDEIEKKLKDLMDIEHIEE